MNDISEETCRELRKLCQQIPPEETSTKQGLNKFKETLKNLKKTLPEKLAQFDESIGLPATIGAGSLITTTHLLHIVAEINGQIPTLETTLYPASALAMITTALISIPWKESKKEMLEKRKSPQNPEPC